MVSHEGVVTVGRPWGGVRVLRVGPDPVTSPGAREEPNGEAIITMGGAREESRLATHHAPNEMSLFMLSSS